VGIIAAARGSTRHRRSAVDDVPTGGTEVMVDVTTPGAA